MDNQASDLSESAVKPRPSGRGFTALSDKWAQISESENWKRVGLQVELLGEAHVADLLAELKAAGATPADAAVRLSGKFDAYISVAPYVVYSKKESGFYSTNFGWVGDAHSATGTFSLERFSVIMTDDAKLVPYFEALDMVTDNN